MTLTFEDLKASIGKGPCLDPGDIANTYYSDEEFLSALAAKHVLAQAVIHKANPQSAV